MELLIFDNVFKGYTSDSCALNGISFKIESGEFTALAGPSGSGKTTILNIAAGLDKANSGCVRLLGEDLMLSTPEKITELRRYSMGFVFQAYNLIPILTALENVEYPLALRKLTRKERIQFAEKALDEVGLKEYKNRKPSELSGGQQQRVAVARAIVTRPKIIFADEPTANLDSKSSESLLKLFKELNENTKTTFLFSSHDPKVLNIANRIIYLSDGKIERDVSQGTIKSVTDKASHPKMVKPTSLHLIQ